MIAVILKCAGSNATKSFDSVHAPDMLDELPKDKFKGILEPSPDVPVPPAPELKTPQPPTQPLPAAAPATSDVPAQPEDGAGDQIPPIEAILAAPDLAVVAQKALTPKAWAFYSSAATDLITHGKNKELVRRVMMRPRVLKNVKEVSYERDILGFRCKAPFFISPTAMARLAHPDGELAVSRGASNEGIIQCVSLPFFPRCKAKTANNWKDLQQCLIHAQVHRRSCAKGATVLLPTLRQLRPGQDCRDLEIGQVTRNQGHFRDC